MRKYTTCLLATLILVIGCTDVQTVSSGAFGEDTVTKRQSIFNVGARRNTQNNERARSNAVSLGTDQFTNQDRTSSSRDGKAVVVPVDGELVEVSLVNASIVAASKAVLGDALKTQFTVSDKVSGTITVQSTGPIPKDALLELFEAALSANGARLEKDGNTLKVVPGTSGNKSFRLASNRLTGGSNIVVAPVEFVSSVQMVNLLQPLVADGLTAYADKRRNLVLLSGSQAQLEAALDALNLFDVDVLQGKSVALVQLDSADPESIVDELNVIFENNEGGNLEGVIEFIPNKRLGSVLIISSRSRYLQRAQKWIRQLDRTAGGAERYIETYELQNRSATDVAPVLNDLLADGLDPNAEEEIDDSTSGPSRVAADKSRNALLVRATRSEHREIRNLLNEIDSSPQQVMIEATIVEVTLNDELDLGVRWFFESGNFDFTFSDSGSGSTGGNFPGFSAVFGTGGAAAAINALSGVTDVKIISSPTLVVLDNEEAILQIGDQVPVAVQTSTDNSSGTAPTVSTIEYRDTGVILVVKPNISRNGRVVLDVVQEVSTVAETQTSGIDSPTIRQRKVETNVLLNDGATLALGGLVQESDTKTITKVPGIGDAPILGGLFRRTESTKQRSELLVLIRPRLIDTAVDARTVTEYWRSQLSQADALLASGLGSPRHTVSDVLP